MVWWHTLYQVHFCFTKFLLFLWLLWEKKNCIFTNLKRVSFKKGEIFMHYDKNINLIFASIHQCMLWSSENKIKMAPLPPTSGSCAPRDPWGSPPAPPHRPRSRHRWSDPEPTVFNLRFIQCSGSMTFWCGSGSENHASDKWIWIRILLFSSLTFNTSTKN